MQQKFIQPYAYQFGFLMFVGFEEMRSKGIAANTFRDCVRVSNILWVDNWRFMDNCLKNIKSIFIDLTKYLLCLKDIELQLIFNTAFEAFAEITNIIFF